MPTSHHPTESVVTPRPAVVAANAHTMSSTIATMVARLRCNFGLTVAELHKKSGIPVATLEEIENGRVVPTVRQLWSLARVFEVPFRVLTASETLRPDVFRVLRAEDGPTLLSGGGRFRSRALSAASDPRVPEMYEITLAPGCIEEATPHPDETYENIVVIRGRLWLRTPDQDAVLRPGDALFFRADVPHVYENPGPQETVALLAMTNAGDWGGS